MDQLALQNQSTGLSQYSRSMVDKTYADSRESIFGHLVAERGYSIKAALEELRPTARTTHSQTVTAESVCKWAGIGSLGVGILVGASMGIGFAALPILAGSLSLKLWSDSRSELPRRSAEYHLLKESGNLPEALLRFALARCSSARVDFCLRWFGECC